MKTIPLDDITLRKGAHDNRASGVCLMEAVAWFAGEKHSDAPECACPVPTGMGQRLNDTLPDDLRIRLLPMVPRLVGTRGDGMAKRRGLMAADWTIRTYTPTWLRLAKLNNEAAALESLPEIVDAATMQASLDALNRARKKADAAGADAGDAAGAAAGAALKPTVERLQLSAIDLYGRMCNLRPEGIQAPTITTAEVMLPVGMARGSRIREMPNPSHS